jgi:hypothetical protein
METPRRIQELQVQHFYKADPDYSTGVAKGLGFDISKIVASIEPWSWPTGNPLQKPIWTGEALSSPVHFSRALLLVQKSNRPKNQMKHPCCKIASEGLD